MGGAFEKFWDKHGDGILQGAALILSDGMSAEGEAAGGRLKPNMEAEGPHTSFKTDGAGKVTKYETYRPQTNPRNPSPWESVQRFDKTGDEHYNKVTKEYVPTPHMHDPQTPGGIRPATPEEIPPE